ncbi:MAG: tRNA (adenosine(37)-N6)-threonylcarbamoyltransferase complex transferase subunit TsaD [Legionellaceae bacterium]
MLVLGIESSCDETGVALYCGERGLVAQALDSQIEIHRRFGGVVPELASRNHIIHLVPLVEDVLAQAQVDKHALDAIAYTAGPGLVGALLVGASFAKSMAFALNIKAIAVHHLEAHLLAAQLENQTLKFPFTALLVSGGHTQFIAARALGDYLLLGETLDDAVGEAFDKTAKLMGLAYPGGPLLAALADAFVHEPGISPAVAPFPRPMLDRPGLDLSFSGLKTHALTTWNKSDKQEGARSAIARAFQDAVVETLAVKCQRALDVTGDGRLVVAGGVGANRALRKALSRVMDERGGVAYFPSPAFCTDNGAMVAYAGYLHLLQGEYDPTSAIHVKARWPMLDVYSPRQMT